jgi:hypothetical protein
LVTSWASSHQLAPLSSTQHKKKLQQGRSKP